MKAIVPIEPTFNTIPNTKQDMTEQTAQIPDSAMDLFERETYAQFGTVMPDGTPHITPVWVDHDGSDVLIQTTCAYPRLSGGG